MTETHAPGIDPAGVRADEGMIRVIVQQASASMAANVGGPVEVSYVTFDIHAPDLVRHMRSKWDSLGHRTIVGVEILPTPEPSHD